MDVADKKSPLVVDHRAVASHGGVGITGILLGLLFGHPSTPPAPDPDLDLVQVTSTAIDRGGDFWAGHLEPRVWRPPHVVLINHSESTPCGTADDHSGPFYCPANERIYLDLAFLRAIPGDLARAYVVAHELGHHVQKLRGEFDKRGDVAIELQADCYAGAWMRAEHHLTEDDVAQALAEAQAVGDDRINPSSAPETWTHGSAAQRSHAVLEGLGGSACR